LSFGFRVARGNDRQEVGEDLQESAKDQEGSNDRVNIILNIFVVREDDAKDAANNEENASTRCQMVHNQGFLC
jgi:alkanesulfonate monooxygenase SsuD/methylene tetrahydromethanopterin reductase-like flavin-dependent oxidoreductase (luciferase family)